MCAAECQPKPLVAAGYYTDCTAQPYERTFEESGQGGIAVTRWPALIVAVLTLAACGANTSHPPKVSGLAEAITADNATDIQPYQDVLYKLDNRCREDEAQIVHFALVDQATS